ncbi:glycosyltransferase family 2 protein [Anaerolactibacter massiliensis]|uniref:glycosyltransferase family 2 protein n=1 Tax=Anaerolactibacter massiliensis TaxID=2044573 RepID=UPI000CF9FFE9|nr:glycosyltransferase [Anaerolactibacter massiliensis]
MNIDIICPLFNGAKYLDGLHDALLRQEKADLHEVHYVVTETGDGIQEKLNTKEKCVYRTISKEEFSHSLTREKEAFLCTADIIVFITQDIRIQRSDWLHELVKPIIENKCSASFSRQISTNHSIERYTREFNYPDHSMIKSRSDLEKMGTYTYFFSDASSAVDRRVFVKLNGYDQKNFPSNEDTYFAYKLIAEGYRIGYCADSVVEHSHSFTLKQLYDRYYLTGKFFAMEPDLQKSKTTRAGASLAEYILKRSLEERNMKAILNFVPNMAARYLGMKAGQRHG